MNAPIIYLNGPSCSGKSSIARAFQEVWPNPVLYASIDHYMDMLPEGFMADDARRKTLPRSLAESFPKCLPTLNESGLAIVVDYYVGKRSWLEKLSESLQNMNAVFVELRTPIEELERRGKLRGDPNVEVARSQFERMYRSGVCDIEIDTTELLPEESALLIRDYLISENEPRAFSLIREKLSLELRCESS